MLKKKALLVVNPFSGNKRGLRAAALIARRLRFRYDLSLFVSNGPGEAAEAVLKAKDSIEVVFVVGGDGTLNEVLQVVVNTPLILGVFPVGSGNATAYELGVLTMKQGVRRILNQNVRTYDCGQMNERYFMNIVGTGFDTVVAAEFDKKENRGLAGYVRLILKNYFNYVPIKVFLDDDEKKWQRKIFMVNIANMRQLGNFAFTAPMAKPDDGVLDLCILKPFPKAFTSDILLRLFARNLQTSRYYEHCPVKKILIQGDFSYANIDGEIIFVDGKMEIKVIPQSVRIYS